MARNKILETNSAPVRVGDTLPVSATGVADFNRVEAKTLVKPVANAIAILRHLGQCGRPATATQIARALKINTSTCFNILRTLASEDVVRFDEVGKTYKLGVGLLTLMSDLLSEESRLEAARGHLLDFASRHAATVCLWRRVSLERNTLVATEHGPGNVRIQLQVGESLPVLLGSTGRVMATRLGLSKAQVRQRFEELRWYNKPSFESYWRDALEAAERGWAVDDANFSAGVLTISAPVISSMGAVGYSLTFLSFRDLHRDHPLSEIGEDLIETAARLSTILY